MNIILLNTKNKIKNKFDLYVWLKTVNGTSDEKKRKSAPQK